MEAAFLNLVRTEASVFEHRKACEAEVAAANATTRTNRYRETFHRLVHTLFEHLGSLLPEQFPPLSALASSHTFSVLRSALEDALKHKHHDDRDDIAPVACAIMAFYEGRKSTPREEDAGDVALIQWFGEEVCKGLWDLENAWEGWADGITDCYCMNPMHAAVAYGTPALVSFLHRDRGLPFDDVATISFECSTIHMAFYYDNVATFKHLLELGVDVCARDDQDEATGLGLLAGSYGTHPFGDRKREMLCHLVSTRPEIMTSVSKLPFEVGKPAACVLTAAILSRDATVVRAVMDAGARLRYRREDSEFGPLQPTIVTAFEFPSYEVIKVLVEEYGALRDYESKLEPEAIHIITSRLAELSLSPGYGCGTDKFGCNWGDDEDELRAVEVVLSGGFSRTWSPEGSNVLLSQLKAQARGLTERTAMAALEQYRKAGLNITHLKKDDADNGRWDNSLAHLAADAGWPTVLDYAIGVAGCPVDYPQPDDTKELTPLTTALKSRRFDVALVMLTEYKLKAAYPKLPVDRQPISVLLRPEVDADRYLYLVHGAAFVDGRLETLLAALIDRDPGLLDIDCFKDPSLTWNPIAHCVFHHKPKLLELLLSGKLPAASQLATCAVPLQFPSRNFTATVNLAQLAAHNGCWDCINTLLVHCPGPWAVTQPIYCHRSSDGSEGVLSSVVELAQAAKGSDNAPPRALLARLAERSRLETLLLQTAAAMGIGSTDPSESAGGTGAASAAEDASNSFVDPLFKAITVRGVKKRERRKAAKKRRRARKRAEEKDDATSTDEAFSEPDDNLVDSRYAPSLDILLAERARREASEGKK